MFQVVHHTLAEHWLAEIRTEQTPATRFRDAVRKLGALLAAEVLRDAPLTETPIQTPCGLAIGRQLANQTILVPVLRAGLVYAEGMAEIIPNAIFGHIGLFRDECTHRPVPYFSKLPRKLAGTQILIADPMLATGHSAVAAVDTVLNAGAEPEQIRFLALVAAPEGVRCFEAAHPHIDIRAFALDERLNDQAYIVPGLGDAGDRLFGTC